MSRLLLSMMELSYKGVHQIVSKGLYKDVHVIPGMPLSVWVI
jgi:hypothetical protein